MYILYIHEKFSRYYFPFHNENHQRACFPPKNVEKNKIVLTVSPFHLRLSFEYLKAEKEKIWNIVKYECIKLDCSVISFITIVHSATTVILSISDLCGVGGEWYNRVQSNITNLIFRRKYFNNNKCVKKTPNKHFLMLISRYYWGGCSAKGMDRLVLCFKSRTIFNAKNSSGAWC